TETNPATNLTGSNRHSNLYPVILAQAGIQPRRYRNLSKKSFFRFYVLDSHFRGNDGMQVSARTDSAFPLSQKCRLLVCCLYKIIR
ncbi:TPA: hypothetical protein ACFJD2_001115, partial [Neisseria gonorrhoeae]